MTARQIRGTEPHNPWPSPRRQPHADQSPPLDLGRGDARPEEEVRGDTRPEGRGRQHGRRGRWYAAGGEREVACKSKEREKRKEKKKKENEKKSWDSQMRARFRGP